MGRRAEGIPCVWLQIRSESGKSGTVRGRGDERNHVWTVFPKTGSRPRRAPVQATRSDGVGRRQPLHPTSGGMMRIWIRKCPCGQPFRTDRKGQAFCSRSCSNRFLRRGRALRRFSTTYYSRHKDEVHERERERYHSDPNFRARVIARAKSRQDGRTPEPCEICGAPNSQRHHPDYSKPLEYRWLCPKHHRAEHRKG